jgi:hypothetical protein
MGFCLLWFPGRGTSSIQTTAVNGQSNGQDPQSVQGRQPLPHDTVAPGRQIFLGESSLSTNSSCRSARNPIASMSGRRSTQTSCPRPLRCSW